MAISHMAISHLRHSHALFYKSKHPASLEKKNEKTTKSEGNLARISGIARGQGTREDQSQSSLAGSINPEGGPHSPSPLSPPG